MNNIIKVTNLVVRNDGGILLIKEWSKKKNGYFWNLIKGTFDNKKDTSILDTLKREAKEEIGLVCDIVGVLNVSERTSQENFLIQINLISHPKRGASPQIPNKFGPDEEIIEYKWFLEKEFMKIKKKEFMKESIRDIVSNWFSEEKFYPISIFIKHYD